MELYAFDQLEIRIVKPDIGWASIELKPADYKCLLLLGPYQRC